MLYQCSSVLSVLLLSLLYQCFHAVVVFQVDAMNNRSSSRTNPSTRSVAATRATRPGPGLEESIMEGLQLINSRLNALERYTAVPPPESANTSEPATVTTYTRPTISPMAISRPGLSSTESYNQYNNQYGHVTLTMVPASQFSSPVVTSPRATNLPNSQSGRRGSSAQGSQGTSQSSVYEEHRRIFGFGQYSPSVTAVSRHDRKSRKGKGPAVPGKRRKLTAEFWKKEVACLRFADSSRVPDVTEKMAMAKMGLSSREISFDLDGDELYLHDTLMYEFPALQNTGGYTLLRPNTNSHDLLSIEWPHKGGITIRYLKEILCSARLYVRPLQFDILDLDSEDIKQKDEDEQSCQIQPFETCRNCKRSFSLSELHHHLNTCFKGSHKDETEEQETSCSLPIDVDDNNIFNDDDDDDEILQRVIEMSKSDIAPSTLGDVVEVLRKGVTDKEFYVIIRRSCILDDLLECMAKTGFSTSMKLNVEFVGEEGTDTGGLTRELFTLAAKKALESHVTARGYFYHNILALQGKVYFRLGQLAGMSLVHGGSSFCLLADPVVMYISGTSITDIAVPAEDIQDTEIKTLIDQMKNASNDDDMKHLYQSNLDQFYQAGIIMPIRSLTVNDKTKIIKMISLNELIKIKAEIDQFKEGMECLGVVTAIQRYPDLLRGFFTIGKETPLTAEMMRNLFTHINFSIEQSNQRIREESTYMFFLRYLEECEEKTDNMSLNSIMRFFTGADEIPPYGFPTDPILHFSQDPYPTASKCAAELTLPTIYDEYHDFKRNMRTAMEMHGGFGKS